MWNECREDARDHHMPSVYFHVWQTVYMYSSGMLDPLQWTQDAITFDLI